MLKSVKVVVEFLALGLYSTLFISTAQREAYLPPPHRGDHLGHKDGKYDRAVAVAKMWHENSLIANLLGCFEEDGDWERCFLGCWRVVITFD